MKIENPFVAVEDERKMVASWSGYRLYAERTYFGLEDDSAYTTRYSLVDTLPRRIVRVEKTDSLGREYGIKISGQTFAEDRIDRLMLATEEARAVARHFTEIVQSHENAVH